MLKDAIKRSVVQRHFPYPCFAIAKVDSCCAHFCDFGKMKYIVASIVLSLLQVASAEVKELTAANFGVETAGKTVFIKFFAPW